MTNKTIAPLATMPRWFRALAVDASIYAPSILPLITLARMDDAVAMRACERHAAARR